MNVELTVNDQDERIDVEPRCTLADALREELGLTGTHIGCQQGACGACTVLVDDVPVRSCLMYAVQAEGSRVTTVEGLSSGEDLHPLQEAFAEHHGLQCGFCTPGMLLSALYLLRTRPDLSRDDVRAELAGNLCRCTGYQGIVDAVMAVAETPEVTGL